MAAALIDTVGPGEAVDLMVDHFGWDATMQAASALKEPHAGRVLYLAVQTLMPDAD